jgi:hypothetical protein
MEGRHLFCDSLNGISRAGSQRLTAPAADVQCLPVRGTAQIVGQVRIVYAFRRHDATDAQSRKGKSALTPLWLVQVVQENVDQLLQYLAIRSFLHRCRASIRWQSDQAHVSRSSKWSREK